MQALANTLKRLTSLSRKLCGGTRQAPRSARLGLESLEDRMVPTVTPTLALTNINLTAIHFPITAIQAPTAPTGFTVQEVSSTQASMWWSPVSNASGYLVDEWVNGAWKQIASLSSSTDYFSVGGLSAGNRYYFDVAATNVAGTSWANFLSTVTVDHPTAGGAYSPVSGTLFGANGPSYLDVRQGSVGDCWLEASLAEVAARAPADITSMFSYLGTNLENGNTVSLYSVRLYGTNGTAHYITVDTELPNGGGEYDHPNNGVLWVTLAEKAYVQANAQGWVTTNHEYSDSYSAIDGGNATWALHAITGKASSAYSINPTNIVSAWNSGKLIVLCTTNPPSTDIVGNHVYAMVGYNASSGLPFEVYNPWGTTSTGYAPYLENGHQVYGLFYANAAFISQNFGSYAVGGAAETTQGHLTGFLGNEIQPNQNTTALPAIPAAVTGTMANQVDATTLLALQTQTPAGPIGDGYWAQTGRQDSGPDSLGHSGLLF